MIDASILRAAKGESKPVSAPKTRNPKNRVNRESSMGEFEIPKGQQKLKNKTTEELLQDFFGIINTEGNIPQSNKINIL